MKEGGGFDANSGPMSDKRQLVLKCDLQERILDPALFGATLQQQMVRSSYIMTLRYSTAENIYLKIIFTFFTSCSHEYFFNIILTIFFRLVLMIT